MKPSQVKLQSTSETQTEQTAQQTSQTSARREFATVEDLLRYDAAQTNVPAQVGEKLGHSLKDNRPPSGAPASWWKRWFGQ